MKGEVRRVSTLQSLASRNIDNTELNLRILQRHNPDASRIIAVGNHISLFLYHQEAWTKSDMEGCIFFYTKITNPNELCIFILNRQSTQNYSAHIDQPDAHLQFERNFLIIEGNELLGLWFYDEKEYNRVRQVLELFCQSLQSSQRNIATILKDASERRRSSTLVTASDSTTNVNNPLAYLDQKIVQLLFGGLEEQNFRSLREFQAALIHNLQSDPIRMLNLFDLYNKTCNKRVTKQ